MATKLTSREKNLLLLCIGVLVFMALAILVNDFMSRRKVVQEKIVSLQRQKQENDTWVQDRAFWDKRRAWLAETMPTTESLGRAQGQLLEDLQNEALELGISAEQPTLPPLATPTDSHREITVAVRLKGDQAVILQWLASLQSPEKFQAIRQMKLEIDTKAREKTPQVVCDMTLARWFKPETGL